MLQIHKHNIISAVIIIIVGRDETTADLNVEGDIGKLKPPYHTTSINMLSLLLGEDDQGNELEEDEQSEPGEEEENELTEETEMMEDSSE